MNGKMDILGNNAGGSVHVPVEEMAEEQ